MKNLSCPFLKLSGIVLSTSIVLFSCSQSSEYMTGNEDKAKVFADSVSNVIQSINQTSIKTDSNRTFVRNADLSFKVKDVKMSTYDIERIIFEHNGYVTSSILESTINYKNSIRTSKDSMLDITNYTVNNNIVMRVPNNELDKTLTQISGLIDYLEYRKIKSDDVTKKFQTSKLSENRFINHKKRLEKAIETNGKKLDQIVTAENELLVKQEWADDSKLNTLELAYDVSYSTVTINIYQKETTRKDAYAYSLPSEPYEPNFGVKLLESVGSGASVFGEILLFFIKFWPIAILIIGIVALIKLVLNQKWFA